MYLDIGMGQDCDTTGEPQELSKYLKIYTMSLVIVQKILKLLWDSISWQLEWLSLKTK